MTNDMLTRLSISVSGKSDGKKAIADMIVAAIQSVHGTVAQRKGDNNGEHLKIELTAEAMKAAGAGTFPPPLVSFMGADVEIRGGKIRAIPLAVEDAPKPTSAAVNLNGAFMSELTELVQLREAAVRALTGYIPTARLGAPSFVPSDQLTALVRSSAATEIKRLDGELAALGFRWKDQA